MSGTGGMRALIIRLHVGLGEVYDLDPDKIDRLNGHLGEREEAHRLDATCREVPISLVAGLCRLVPEERVRVRVCKCGASCGATAVEP